jgi:hypothetical protein
MMMMIFTFGICLFVVVVCIDTGIVIVDVCCYYICALIVVAFCYYCYICSMTIYGIYVFTFVGTLFVVVVPVLLKTDVLMIGVVLHDVLCP